MQSGRDLLCWRSVMSRRGKRPALRIPRRLVCTALHVAVAGALGCGHDTTPAHDAAAAHDAAVADLRPPNGDACPLAVYCAPVVPGASCGGIFCDVKDCPTGCEPYV
jgi:hypothetical protein